ncbi:hypothetical protein [Inquilinus sp. CAU 1745]|uniref:hypothetical protein n=1 Tax=Inquilinus sp. CAU 1745 TaxID=3140369 RepID=UPI00325BAEAA
MIALGILLSVAGIGFFCWLLFTLAVYALPFFAGMTVGLWAYDSGAGPIGAFLVGAFAAGLTFGLGQLMFTTVRAVWVRFAIALAFAAPAAFTGYHATLGLTRLTMPSEEWQMAFSVLGAIAIGLTAWTRVVAMAPSGQTGQVAARG